MNEAHDWPGMFAATITAVIAIVMGALWISGRAGKLSAEIVASRDKTSAEVAELRKTVAALSERVAKLEARGGP